MEKKKKWLYTEQDAEEELNHDEQIVDLVDQKQWLTFFWSWNCWHLVETTRTEVTRGKTTLVAQNNGTAVIGPLDLEGKHKRGIWNSSDNYCCEKLKEYG